jgi:hypothetical protein
MSKVTNWVTEGGRHIESDEIVVVTVPSGTEMGVQLTAYGEVTDFQGDGVLGISDMEREEASWETEGITFDSREYVIWSEPDKTQVRSDEGSAQCRHCKRDIKLDGDIWIDPEATGDDSIWREVCDAHDTFIADHEPVTEVTT